MFLTISWRRRTWRAGCYVCRIGCQVRMSGMRMRIWVGMKGWVVHTGKRITSKSPRSWRSLTSSLSKCFGSSVRWSQVIVSLVMMRCGHHKVLRVFGLHYFNTNLLIQKQQLQSPLLGIKEKSCRSPSSSSTTTTRNKRNSWEGMLKILCSFSLRVSRMTEAVVVSFQPFSHPAPPSLARLEADRQTTRREETHVWSRIRKTEVCLEPLEVSWKVFFPLPFAWQSNKWRRSTFTCHESLIQRAHHWADKKRKKNKRNPHKEWQSPDKLNTNCRDRLTNNNILNELCKAL